MRRIVPSVAVAGDRGDAIGLGAGPEFDRIRGIARALGPAASGLGDDCALIAVGSEMLAASVDLSVEGIHFRRDWLSLKEVGWKATAGALSDLAAMGAEVIGVLTAVAVPAESDETQLRELMSGVGAAVQDAGGKVLGGDLSSGPLWTIDVAVLGRTDHPVRRIGAEPGDQVYVTGQLGGARAALKDFSAKGPEQPAFRKRFAHPVPRITAGQWLARHGARAMIDLSDGLAGDAAHLAAASGVALHLDIGLLPLETGLVEWAGHTESAALAAAAGGEDYELLAAMPSSFGSRDASAMHEETGVRLTRIGEVTTGAGVHLRLAGKPVVVSSFDHFT